MPLRAAAVPTFYEFFAGGGMARAGLVPQWECLFSNDFDQSKCATYRLNWGDGEMMSGDVRKLAASGLPSRADLIWASFPCQDLSLAGGGAGLRGERSGTFWPFWTLVSELVDEGRAPELIVLENVVGTLTSHAGADFRSICGALADQGYYFGGLVIDAALFVPHSRPRLFIVAAKRAPEPQEIASGPNPIWHTRALRTAHEGLADSIKARWVWWDLVEPDQLRLPLSSLIEECPNDVRWHDAGETQRLISMMSPLHRRKLQAVQSSGARAVGTIYKRTRRDADGAKVQRAEVRFDDVAGCLRTPAGGSSRQTIMIVEGDRVRSRLLSARETARLMGLPDTYLLPERYNEAYHLTGDGVAVPVVKHLSENLLLPHVLRRTYRNAA